MRTTHLLFFPLMMLALSPVYASPKGPWKRATETSDGIIVDFRQDPKAGIGEIRAQTTINMPPEVLMKVVLDLENYKTFMPYMKTSKVLKRQGAHIWKYCQVDAPVVSMRDYTLKFTVLDPTHRTAAEVGQGMKAKAKRWKLSWQADNASGPKKNDKYVRVELANGSWTFNPKGDGKSSDVWYRLLTHPGGSIPTWLANKANTRAVPDVIRAVRKQAKKAKYRLK
ncbi:MAG: START domain-containing protein [Myxococcota bacterium]|jgi:ribosome-associated toxin RatA of RatAB toxin-antitoxin module|nr:hypothetical protein [Myxococcales bacterium]MBF94597.1 hypothetical protein [Myxococcales bacterium]MEC7751872.1 START domain-containing protein [Myxococcota bacterium]HBU46726.1 hypothetical protein [Myxococcales bacterium]